MPAKSARTKPGEGSLFDIGDVAPGAEFRWNGCRFKVFRQAGRTTFADCLGPSMWAGMRVQLKHKVRVEALLPGSSNGRTPGFGPGGEGSTPSPGIAAPVFKAPSQEDGAGSTAARAGAA